MQVNAFFNGYWWGYFVNLSNRQEKNTRERAISNLNHAIAGCIWVK